MKQVLPFIFLLLFCGCSISYKVRKTYENAAALNPITNADSLNLVKASKKVVKEVKPKVLPGKTIRVPYPVVKNKIVLDSGYVDRVVDSLLLLNAEEINSTVDECIANERKARKEALQQGIREGYAKRNKEILTDSFDTKLPDTVREDNPTVVLDLSDCRFTLRGVQDELVAMTAKKNTFQWLFYLLLGGLIVGGFFVVRNLISPKNKI